MLRLRSGAWEGGADESARLSTGGAESIKHVPPVGAARRKVRMIEILGRVAAHTELLHDVA